MRVIKLCNGPGNGVDKACLMTATSMLVGRPEEGDHTSCVCEVLRAFIVPTNDYMDDKTRMAVYGDPMLAYELPGTRTDDPAVMQLRALVFADYAVRRWAPAALDAAGLRGEANELRALPKLTKENARAAGAAAGAAAWAAGAARAAGAAAGAAARDAGDAATAAAWAAWAAARAAGAAAGAAATAAAWAAAWAARDAARAAGAAAGAAARDAGDAAGAAAWAAAWAAAGDAGAGIWRDCATAIREAAAIWDKRPVEYAMTVDQLVSCLR